MDARQHIIRKAIEERKAHPRGGRPKTMNTPETSTPDSLGAATGWATVEQWRAEKKREGDLRFAALQLLCLLSPLDWSYIFGHPKYGDIAIRINAEMERVGVALRAYEGGRVEEVNY